MAVTCLKWVTMSAVAPGPLTNGALVLSPETVRFAVSMIPTKIGIYLALLDKRHVVAAADAVAAAHSNRVLIHLIRSRRTHHSPHCVASRTSAAHDYTSIHPCSFLTALRQTRTRSTASNQSDVDSIQILLDTGRRQMSQNLLDSRPMISLWSTAVATVHLLDVL